MAVVLPKFVVFKADNNKYMKCYHGWQGQFVLFSTDEKGDIFEIDPAANGNIRIKSGDNLCFWRVGENGYVYVDADPLYTSSKDPATLFRPIQLDDHTIALQNVGNNNFCKRDSEGKLEDMLRADLATVDTCSKLKVEEPVLSREIYDIWYDVDNAKIYGDTAVVVYEIFFSTGYLHEPLNIPLEIDYEDIKVATWKASIWFKTNVNATAQARIPLVAEGRKVEVSHEFQAGIKWGKTEIKKTRKKARVTPKLLLPTMYMPPKSKCKITLVAEQGSCDVPFIYKQKDTLYKDIPYKGSTVVHEYSGIFTCTNYYRTHFEITLLESL